MPARRGLHASHRQTVVDVTGRAADGAPLSGPGIPARLGAPRRVVTVGLSVRRTCGVRDHATLLSEALARDGLDCRMWWLQRSGGSLVHESREIRRWTRELLAELARDPPEALLLHYSVFSYSYRGVPIFVPRLLAALRSTGIPIMTIMHEFAYPWRYGGWRGGVWAVTQRILLVDVMRTSASVLVTDEERATWLPSRRWLPRRPVLFAPVFSNLPPPVVPPPVVLPPPEPDPPSVGLFGYAYQGAAVATVLDALSMLAAEGLRAQLNLLGNPGAASAVGRQWRSAARDRGIEDLLRFSGTLSAQDLADALAGCGVLLFADSFGPSSRKGTLAGSLSSGRPVIALDGPRRWQELLRSEALLLVQPSPAALADALRRLLQDVWRASASVPAVAPSPTRAWVSSARRRP